MKKRKIIMTMMLATVCAVYSNAQDTMWETYQHMKNLGYHNEPKQEVKTPAKNHAAALIKALADGGGLEQAVEAYRADSNKDGRVALVTFTSLSECNFEDIDWVNLMSAGYFTPGFYNGAAKRATPAMDVLLKAVQNDRISKDMAKTLVKIDYDNRLAAGESYLKLWKKIERVETNGDALAKAQSKPNISQIRQALKERDKWLDTDRFVPESYILDKDKADARKAKHEAKQKTKDELSWLEKRAIYNAKNWETLGMSKY
ncbi:hypothetical protein Dip518_001279 [Parelusimicrobium proximum]|uniref:hypothetical protein n=1 Tax=Parelusimicrobium proximum TaxID=3228953 RepID=UPI003D172DD5